MHPEEAFLVGLDRLLQLSEARPHLGVRNLTRGEAPVHVEQILPDRVVLGRGGHIVIGDRPPAQDQLGRRAIAQVGQEVDRANAELLAQAELQQVVVILDVAGNLPDRLLPL